MWQSLLLLGLYSVGSVSGGRCTESLECMSTQNCSRLLEGSAHLFTLFACGPDDQWVCCPHAGIRKRDAMEEKMKLLPTIKDCNDLSADRIMNGENATLGQFPWMALIGYRVSKSEPVEYRCGGTIINNRYVLTAAHCLRSPDKAVVEIVRLNELNLATNPDCETFNNVSYCGDDVLDVEVEKVILHEQYNKPSDYKNDIGLIRLKKNVTLKLDSIYPICLPFSLTITDSEETNYTVAGWGKTEDFDERGSQILQYVNLPSIPLADCNLLQASHVRPLSSSQLCAGGQLGKDSCKGDSGGPLMHKSTNGVFQVGIVSFGSLLCGRDIPTVYTNVTAYINWILEKIEP